MMTIDTLARSVLEYFETHSLDKEGTELYLQAEKILGDLQVRHVDNMDEKEYI